MGWTDALPDATRDHRPRFTAFPNQPRQPTQPKIFSKFRAESPFFGPVFCDFHNLSMGHPSLPQLRTWLPTLNPEFPCRPIQETFNLNNLNATHYVRTTKPSTTYFLATQTPFK